MVRAIRGATTVENNIKEEIINETKILLKKVLKENNIKEDDLISILFSTTVDLDTTFPAIAARELGILNVALMCMNEINVKDSLKKCIRILVNINTELSNNEIKHIYLKEAKLLRPDLK